MANSGSARADRSVLFRWAGDHQRSLPWRTGGENRWQVLVAETLLRRTNAKAASRVYPVAIERFPSPQAVVKDPEAWVQLTAPLGLAWRAKGFVHTAEAILRDFGGAVPGERASLLRLPQVGHYAAGAVEVFADGGRAVLVDTNFVRFASRFSGAELDATQHRTARVAEAVRSVLPNPDGVDAEEAWALLDLTALVCKSKGPSCHTCPLRMSCAQSVKSN